MPDYGPSNHDYNSANGMTREQYRDAWLGSGVNTVQGQQDWLAKHGGQMVSGNGQTVTPYGDVLDMQIGARTGNGQPGWTNTGGGMAAPSNLFNIQQDFSNEKNGQLGYTGNPAQTQGGISTAQLQEQMKGPAYAGSALAAQSAGQPKLHTGTGMTTANGYFGAGGSTGVTGGTQYSPGGYQFGGGTNAMGGMNSMGNNGGMNSMNAVAGPSNGVGIGGAIGGTEYPDNGYKFGQGVKPPQVGERPDVNTPQYGPMADPNISNNIRRTMQGYQSNKTGY